MTYDELITHGNTHNDIKKLEQKRNEIEDEITELMEEQKSNYNDDRDMIIGDLALKWVEIDDEINHKVLRRQEWMFKHCLRSPDCDADLGQSILEQIKNLKQS